MAAVNEEAFIACNTKNVESGEVLTALFSSRPDASKISERNVEEMYRKRDIEGLIGFLKHRDSNIQQEAARFLGMMGDPRAAEPLIQVLKGENKIGQASAAVALEKIGAPAVEPLIQVLKDKDKNAQVWAEVVLRKIKDPRAVEALVQALRDEESVVRAGAVDALCEIGGLAVEPLIQALKDENGIVRLGAVAALGGIGDVRAVEALTQATIDEDVRVKIGALIALEKIRRKIAEKAGNSA